MLGQPPGALLDELTNAAPIPSAPPAVPVGLPSELVLRRPDVQQAERQLAAATARVGVATADLYPKFSLTGDVGLQSISAGDWFTAGSRYWAAGPTVQWRIFDAGRIRANIRVQNARVDQALAAYEQSMLAAFTDVETALTGLRQGTKSAGNRWRKPLRLTKRHWSSPMTFIATAWLISCASWNRNARFTKARTLWSESDRAVASDLIALYKALGGGWEEQNRSDSTALRGGL